MKKFMFLHFGFEKPTPKIMEAWKAWFESISDKQVEQGGFNGVKKSRKVGAGLAQKRGEPLNFTVRPSLLLRRFT